MFPSISNPLAGVANKINRTVNGIKSADIDFLPGIDNPFNGLNSSTPRQTFTQPQNRQGTSGAGDNPTNPIKPETPVPSGASSGSGGNDAELQQSRLTLENSINQGNDALGRFDRQQSTALQNIGGQYQSAYDRLMGQQRQAQRNYTTQRDNQIEDYTSARANVDSKSRQLLTGARRLMGSEGAGGGSADLYGAPLAATTEGNNQNAVIKETSQRNLSALDTSNQDNKDAFGRSLNDLGTQRESSERSVKSQYDQQRADVLGQIQALTGQRAIMNGGNYQQAMAAAQPYTSRIQSLLSNIDSYAANPTPIREQAVTLARPDLAQYGLGRFDAPAAARQDATLAPAAYRALLGQQDDQQRQPLGY